MTLEFGHVHSRYGGSLIIVQKATDALLPSDGNISWIADIHHRIVVFLFGNENSGIIQQ